MEDIDVPLEDPSINWFGDMFSKAYENIGISINDNVNQASVDFYSYVDQSKQMMNTARKTV